ncbi:MAG: hypothetical protein F4W92_08425 [Gammaproteobacteria bacterium]|nr:hypothetical protein [Gammaproteobacteria bacterium]
MRIMLGVVAIGYLTVALTLGGLLIVYGSVSNLMLVFLIVALLALSGGSIVLGKTLHQLSNK